MPIFHYPRAAVLLSTMLLLSTNSALASSSVSSEASDASSFSVGGSSQSIERSSDGSSHSSDRHHRMAQGVYTVVETVAIADRPDMLQLQLELQNYAENAVVERFTLKLPRETVQRANLQAGSLVNVAHRPYGLAFSTATAEAAPFFLVLDDDWYRELNSNPVKL